MFCFSEKLQVHFETLENLKKYSASKLFECQKQQQVGGNCSHESQDLERTVVRYFNTISNSFTLRFNLINPLMIFVYKILN